MALTFDISSFLKETKQVARDVQQEMAPNALEEVAKSVINEAKSLTPIDTGKLRSSLDYEIEERAGVHEANLGSDVDYALVVHEDFNVKHNTGGPKFLEKPVIQAGGKLVRAVQKNFQRLD
jgi:hypothetical protein